MPDENVKCPVELKPMLVWVKEPDPRGVCRECLLGPVLQWYRDELDAKGYQEQAHDLEKISHEAEELPLKLCQKFDTIKDEVEEPVRERLLDFDCAAQSWEPDDSG